jgi:putative addiction module CopG family antidote
MSYAFPADVQQLIAGRMATGGYATEEDVLRDALRALAEEEEDIAAVRDAVAEFRSGDAGLPLGEAFELVRRSQIRSTDP